MLDAVSSWIEKISLSDVTPAMVCGDGSVYDATRLRSMMIERALRDGVFPSSPLSCFERSSPRFRIDKGRLKRIIAEVEEARKLLVNEEAAACSSPPPPQPPPLPDDLLKRPPVILRRHTTRYNRRVQTVVGRIEAARRIHRRHSMPTRSSLTAAQEHWQVYNEIVELIALSGPQRKKPVERTLSPIGVSPDQVRNTVAFFESPVSSSASPSIKNNNDNNNASDNDEFLPVGSRERRRVRKIVAKFETSLQSVEEDTHLHSEDEKTVAEAEVEEEDEEQLVSNLYKVWSLFTRKARQLYLRRPN